MDKEVRRMIEAHDRAREAYERLYQVAPNHTLLGYVIREGNGLDINPEKAADFRRRFTTEERPAQLRLTAIWSNYATVLERARAKFT